MDAPVQSGQTETRHGQYVKTNATKIKTPNFRGMKHVVNGLGTIAYQKIKVNEYTRRGTGLK